jgi:hypothetical protein
MPLPSITPLLNYWLRKCMPSPPVEHHRNKVRKVISFAIYHQFFELPFAKMHAFPIYWSFWELSEKSACLRHLSLSSSTIVEMHSSAIYSVFSELTEKSACLRHLSSILFSIGSENACFRHLLNIFWTNAEKCMRSPSFFNFLNYRLRKCMSALSIPNFLNYWWRNTHACLICLPFLCKSLCFAFCTVIIVPSRNVMFAGLCYKAAGYYSKHLFACVTKK